MLHFFLLLSACVRALAAESSRETISISLQPISVIDYKPINIASITLDPLNLDTEVSFYEKPDFSEAFEEQSTPKIRYFRLGIYDAMTKTWKSSTTITSVDSFSKGYSPTFILSLNTKGAVIGVSVKSHRIDAGQTRDFGPKIKTMRMKNGPKPSLNKPVVFKEGVLEEPIPEKSLLQK